MADYARENITMLAPEIAPLIQAGITERYGASRVRVAPNLDVYCASEDRNLLYCFTARDGRHLVGIAIFLLSVRPHAEDELIAVLDALYVLPEHRCNGVATGLLRFGESALRAAHVDSIAAGTHDVRIARWLRMTFGYAYSETLLEKVL